MSRDRPPEIFNSDIHLPRWRRVLIWCCESHALGWAIFAALLSVIFLFRWWGVAVVAALTIGFYAGYWTARAYLLDGDDIPPL